MNLPRFFAELKRRNVYKVAIAYAVVGWLLIQIATQVFPFFEIPNGIVRLVVLAIVVGFPIALVIAWAFELTPEGLKRTENAETTAPRPQSYAWIGVALTAAALSLGLFLLGRYTRPNESNSPTATTAKSIAVLPFENLSEDKANAYFANGIQDEILTRLSKIADLKVISRTSTQQFQSKPGNIADIAKQLGVATVLEGSVQKSKDSVRVNVQLIKADGDSHLWAETYDRQLTDLFAVESEVAQKIAGSLAATLTGREKAAVAVEGTTNPRAYEFLLRALALRSDTSGKRALDAIAYCQRATELDPGYSEAWAWLAILQAMRFDSPWQSEELEKSAQVAAETSLRLAPESSRAHQAMGLYYSNCRNDQQAALAEMEKAYAVAPNDSAILSDLGRLLRSAGKTEDGLKAMRKAAELDPLNADAWSALGETAQGLRRYDEARAMYDRALAIPPNDINFLALKASTYQAQGNLDAAWQVLRTRPFPAFSEYAIVFYFQQYLLWRDYGALIEFTKANVQREKNTVPILAAAGDILLANVYLLNDERDLALPHAQKAEGEMKELRAQKFGEYEVSESYIELMGRLGNRDEVELEIQRLFAQVGNDRWLLPAYENIAAKGYTLLGDFDKALPLLQDSLAQPNGTSPARLRLDPAWDLVRNDLRFQKLCEEGSP